METQSLIPFNWFTTPARRGEANPFLALQREMDRLFEDFGRSFDGPSTRLAAPRVDISETPTESRITAEPPGISEKDVEISVQDDILTIRGEKRAEHEDKNASRHLVERNYGAFARSFQLPPGYDPDKISASFDKGVLTLTLPKPPEVQSRTKKIEVKSAG
jgi:HSP20 family protein